MFLGFLLGLKRLHGFLELPNVLPRNLSRLGKLRHHGEGTPAEETQNLIQKPEPRGVAWDEGLKNVGIADLAHAPHSLLPLQPVNRGLNRGISRARLRKSLLNLPDGCLPLRPKDFQNSELKPGQFWFRHRILLFRHRIYYLVVVMSIEIF